MYSARGNAYVRQTSDDVGIGPSAERWSSEIRGQRLRSCRGLYYRTYYSWCEASCLYANRSNTRVVSVIRPVFAERVVSSVRR